MSYRRWSRVVARGTVPLAPERDETSTMDYWADESSLLLDAVNDDDD